MVNSKGVFSWVVVAVVVSVVAVSSVLPVVQGKASKAPAGVDFSSFAAPPAPSEDCVGVAAAPGGGAALVADPNDCTKYSVCTDTFSSKLTCPPGQHFSVADNRCATPQEAKCDPAFAAVDATDVAANVDLESAAADVADAADV
ncbi:hypothetical protein HPB49_018440 [Dermacentor silvarum]|uniref:Uncharacterized protein n=1 Tax=Dermacentor silvarum TaxID=543639 RepID=A0ACB8D7E4_DERSI|nr:uncharacterized protein LOC119446394 isoform X3 [Dermacentor silvarum]KAH7960260.1 hypothetical protein HPB49_018440 [Dermacentor silvarum]